MASAPSCKAAKLIDWANQKNAENAARSLRRNWPRRSIRHSPHLHVGMIEGGTAHNITAKDCKFFIEFRFVPGESPEDWARAIRNKGGRIIGRNAEGSSGYRI
jgi:acetylornithine deacetylase